MHRTIKFHLNEHCDPAIADGLRRHGVDVTTTPYDLDEVAGRVEFL